MKIIKHLVFSGGGPIGLVEYGALKYLTVNSIINKKNIESIYSTSIGCVVAFVYMLDFDWTWIDDFYIKRPWEKLVNFSYSTYFNIFNDKGFVNKKIIINALKPLFLAKEIPLTITLLEFYNLTAIEFNIFTCNLTSFKKEKLNYSNTPNLELIDAIYMSLTVPLIFAPLYINNCYYLDGGIFINCPINECLFDKKCCHDEILCFTNDKRGPIDLSNNFYKENNYNYDSANYQLTEEANFFEYLIYIIKTLFNKLSIIENENTIAIKNSINTSLSEQMVDIKYWTYVFKTETERDYLVKLGELQGEKFHNILLTLNMPNANETTLNETNANETNANETTLNEINANETNANETNANETNINIE
jgi:predicted acylesterase/phospholipase RssA